MKYWSCQIARPIVDHQHNKLQHNSRVKKKTVNVCLLFIMLMQSVLFVYHFVVFVSTSATMAMGFCEKRDSLTSIMAFIAALLVCESAVAVAAEERTH
jgi:hypothetical protein